MLLDQGEVEKSFRDNATIKGTVLTHFKGRTTTKVVIPEGITVIGARAFAFSSELLEISIPSSVKKIEEYAFIDCPKLHSITVNPQNAVFRSEGNCCIERATNKLIFGCYTSRIPYGVTVIGKDAFNGCTNLTSIAIPSSVTRIEETSFFHCTNLENIMLPDSLTYIGHLAFGDCYSLIELTIPANVTKIVDHAFYGCRGLESILVSSHNAVYHSQGNCCIETNTNCLVFGCKNSNIPDETIVIGQGAFGGCTGLKNIEIPSSVIEIRSEAFCGCKRLEKVTFSEGVEKICTKAFMDCSALKELFLSAGISEIETFAFPGCTSLRSIKVSSKNSVYHSKDDCCIRSRDDVLILGCRNSIIPDGITEIGENAFYNCYGLTDIYLPESVIKIGESAFSGSGLTSITIPRYVEFIGSFAFFQCNDLLSITIPSSVRYIGELALSGYESTSENRKVFCETSRKPGRWHREWTDEDSVVYWSGDWYYNKEGIPIEGSGDWICQELKLPIAPAETIEQERLLADLVKACGQLQAEKHYWGTKENARNSYIRNALDNMGYVLRDQTLLGISSGETDEGELDLDIRKYKDVPWTICEALRVDGGSKADWNSHLKKLLDNYNPNGVRFLVLLTYVDVEKDKFDQIWNSFKNHIQGHDEGKFAFKLDSFKHYQTETWTGNHYIQTAKCKYILGEYTPTVYHVFVRMGR